MEWAWGSYIYIIILIIVTIMISIYIYQHGINNGTLRILVLTRTLIRVLAIPILTIYHVQYELT